MSASLFRLTVAAVVSAFLTGCVVARFPYSRPPPRRTGGVQEVYVEHACRPNEYWDGERCHHKGKGHDKHDHHH
jgi:hypothetical protein